MLDLFRKQQRTEMNHLPESYDGKTQIMSHAAGWPLKDVGSCLECAGVLLDSTEQNNKYV